MLKLGLLVLGAAAGVIACGSSNPPAPPKIAITAVGTDQGSAVEGIITPAGGTLASADGRLLIEVPAGAVASDTTLTIQPITNEAPGGTGAAYRLGPEGQTFAVPATLTFTYDDAEIADSDPAALDIAYQDAIGQWHALDQNTRDEAARTLSVETPHFSDWSRIKGYQIRPPSATLELSETLELSVVFCDSTDAGDDLTNLLYECGNGDTELLTQQVWLVNGATPDVTNRDATFGSIVSTSNSTATYKAPSAAPPVNPIAVSTDFHYSRGRHVILVSNVTVGQPPLSGTIDATRRDGNGLTIVTHATATFTWNDALQSYVTSSGHFNATLDLIQGGCTTHGIGEADIGTMDGYITFASGMQYLFGGGSSVTLNGTTTCGSNTTPYSNTDTQQWWPSVDGTYLVHSDGSIGETVTNGVFGNDTVDMTWSLSVQP
jgi:hypothetical protein